MKKTSPYCSSPGCNRKTRFPAYPYCNECYKNFNGRFSISKRKNYNPSSRKPKKRISLIEGEYRNFINYYINGQQYTFGWPTNDCRDKRVWVGIDEEEIERISESEAHRRIQTNRLIETGSNKGLINSDTSERYGYCNHCSKKLRGNRAKSYCYECWSNHFK